MEEAPENGKESSHSAHDNGMNNNNDITVMIIIITMHVVKKHTMHCIVTTSRST
jgi:hypothetical protein